MPTFRIPTPACRAVEAESEMNAFAEQKMVKFQDLMNGKNIGASVDKILTTKDENSSRQTIDLGNVEAIEDSNENGSARKSQDMEISDAKEDNKEFGALPARFRNPDLIKGYGRGKTDALYRTTSSDYGSRPPNALTLPEKYYGFTRKFTTHLSDCGMYRNHSVNLQK